MTGQGRDFRSDNVAAVAPEVMAALVAANGPATATSYGEDDLTLAMEHELRALFGTEDLWAVTVATGTASNGLALSLVAQPWQSVLTHAEAHVYGSEAGAPEFFTGGAKLLAVPAANGKIDPAGMAARAADLSGHGPHHMPAAALSITNATEWGLVYGPDEVAALAAVARRHDMAVHVDGARFANAVAHLDCHPADITWRAGVDVLSFGATKNGAMAAEVVIAFRRDLAQGLGNRRKRAGHLWSKGRFAAAQILGSIRDGAWLRHAGQANAMAARLGAGLLALPGVTAVAPVQANQVFVSLPDAMMRGLQAAGFQFFARRADAVRFVCAWNCTAADVDTLLDAARTLSTPAARAAE